MNRFILPGLVLILATLLTVVGLRYYREQDSRPTNSALQARYNYANNVLTHFAGHRLWKANGAIHQHWRCMGGGRGRGTNTGEYDFRYTGSKDFIFRTRGRELLREVVSTLMKIYHDMDIFSGPQAVMISGEEALLASPEGWLELRARWLSDDPRVTGPGQDPTLAVRVLRVEYDLCFYPRYEPSEDQDRERLTWVSRSGD